MTKLMEDILIEMSTTNDNKKEKYVNGKITNLSLNDLKTLQEVLTQKKNAIESKPNTSDEERNTIDNINGILTIVKAKYNKEKEKEEEEEY